MTTNAPSLDGVYNITIQGGTVESDSLNVDNLTLNDNKISSDTGAVSFDNDNITTTGSATVSSLNAGSGTIQTTGTVSAGLVTVDDLQMDSSTISNTASGNVTLATTGAGSVSLDMFSAPAIIHSGGSDTAVILRNDNETAGWDIKMAADNQLTISSSGNGDCIQLNSNSPHIIGRNASDASCTLQGRAGNQSKGLIIGTYNSLRNCALNVSNDSTSNALLGMESYAATTPYGLFMDFSAASPNNETQYFMRCTDSTTTRVNVFSNGAFYGNGTYGTVSDQKLKENIVDCNPQLDKLMGLEIKNFNMKDKPEQELIGVIAQQVETVYPRLVESIADTDKDNQPTGSSTKHVKQSVFTWILVKALQEANQKIIDLEARVTALEAP